MLNSYIIIDATKTIESHFIDTCQFTDFLCVGVCTDFDSALNSILEKKPQLVFFHFDKVIPLQLLLELNQYTDQIPYIVAINKEEKNAYAAIKYGVMDYVLTPLLETEIRKSILKYLKFSKNKSQEKLCVKSNGDYHFISLEDIVYLKADNNTTDFYLQNGKIISGFKTMKFFESQLPFYFFRIHNSFIVNINHVSRINIGKSDCHLFNNEHKIPFSRTFKDNVDTIIRRIS